MRAEAKLVRGHRLGHFDRQLGESAQVLRVFGSRFLRSLCGGGGQDRENNQNGERDLGTNSHSGLLGKCDSVQLDGFLGGPLASSAGATDVEPFLSSDAFFL